jgi:hypothetical protein
MLFNPSLSKKVLREEVLDILNSLAADDQLLDTRETDLFTGTSKGARAKILA